MENELAVAQEKESMLQVETIELERKKTSLQNEVFSPSEGSFPPFLSFFWNALVTPLLCS